jgi:hypothetical protein
MAGNLPPGVSVSDLPGSRPEDERWDEYADEHLEPHEDRLKCRHCGNVIEEHPDDHATGCEAVADWPEPPEGRIPEETDMIIPETDPPDGDRDG